MRGSSLPLSIIVVLDQALDERIFLLQGDVDKILLAPFATEAHSNLSIRRRTNAPSVKSLPSYGRVAT